MESGIKIRLIEERDNNALANIIRRTIEEYNAAKPGTVYYDESTDRLSNIFTIPGSIYFVAEQEGSIIGGAGIYPTPGLDDATCELVKMYLLPTARGKGLGLILMKKCFEFARSNGYLRIYLETMPELINAIKLYEKLGFERISTPKGNSGHIGCDIWMEIELAKANI